MRRTAMKSSQTAEAARIVYSSGKDVALSVVMSSNAANTSNSAAIVTTASLGRRRLAVSQSVEISRPILVTSVKSSYTVPVLSVAEHDFDGYVEGRHLWHARHPWHSRHPWHP